MSNIQAQCFEKEKDHREKNKFLKKKVCKRSEEGEHQRGLERAQRERETISEDCDVLEAWEIQ